ncbi:MAG: SAM-dependent methyltransferase [SAR324 cluster bacterium]|uniref:SAM-dependent methyltransferase n=1 Tax=SAR324 cluster bacterium TaxID=2024889 RepID=A0A2A4SZC0_9DELT|nr:MAG: SAM-dependent methyltransferase [SAR324 cluster bacterium]
MIHPLNSKDLNAIERITIGHYDVNAEDFWEGTKDHDVTQNINAFLSACLQEKSLDILDFGCGPGRDVQVFKTLGHRPVGLDGSGEFCKLAHQYTHCPMLQQTFLNLKLPQEAFDGIFANASLFHIPSQELPRVLNQLHDALRPGGILFSSNPRGEGEGWQGERYGHYMELNASQAYLEAADFEVLRYYYRPSGKPCHAQPWLAIVSRSI